MRNRVPFRGTGISNEMTVYNQKAIEFWGTYRVRRFGQCNTQRARWKQGMKKTMNKTEDDFAASILVFGTSHLASFQGHGRKVWA